MNKNLTKLVFIIDKSGSMFYLTESTINSFNSFIDEQKTAKKQTILTTVLFNDKYEILHNNKDIRTIEPLTANDYIADSTTSLNDTLGAILTQEEKIYIHLSKNEKPSKVIFVIITDGLDNTSHFYSSQKIKEIIGSRKEMYNWEFLFFGANICSKEAAEAYDIHLYADYSANDGGTQSVYQTVTTASNLDRSIELKDLNSVK